MAIIVPDDFSTGDLLGMAGWTSEPSPWLRIDQERVNRFAEVTGDRQYIHVDPERAASTPFGGTIVHGYLCLSLVPHLSHGIALRPAGLVMAINYGLDRVRFLQPVRVGSEVRLRLALAEAREKEPGRILLAYKATLEIRGERRPALVARSLVLLVVSS